jgi:hypothetical protein
MESRPSFAAILVVGLGLGVVSTMSCSSSSDETLTADQRAACDDYCTRATACDHDLNLDKCHDRCIDALGACFDSNVDEAADALQTCVDENACLDVVQCSFHISGECFFGV